jgi:hypothetical protein
MSIEEQSTLSRIEGQVAQIKELLSGNPLDVKDVGIAGRQYEMGEKITLLDNKVNKYLWMGIGIASVMTIIFSLIGLWIEYRILLKP